MAIDTKSLSQLITEFRALKAKDSITPESLGYILQRISDLLATAGTSETLTEILQVVNHLKAAGYFMTNIQQGDPDRNHVYAKVEKVSPSSGMGMTTAQILIQQATTERAGAMRAQQVTDLNAARRDVSALQKQVENILTAIDDVAREIDWTNADLDGLRDDVLDNSYLISDLETEVDKIKNGSTSVAGGQTPISIYVTGTSLRIFGASQLMNKGYVPYLFRSAKRRNRNRTEKDQGINRRNPVRKGWLMMGREQVVQVMPDGSVTFCTTHHTYWHKIPRLKADGEKVLYGSTPDLLLIQHLNTRGEPVVSWGKSTVRTNYRHSPEPRMLRFRFAIGFAQPKKLSAETLHPSELASTLAEFSVVQDRDGYLRFSR